MEKGLLIILSGPSGVGKGSVRVELVKDESLNLAYSVSMTTRKMRPGEVEGREYYFVSKEEFDKQVKAGNLLEHATFVGNSYGTPRDKVEALRDQGKNVILEIEVSGTLQVLSKYGEDPKVLSIFLLPPSFEELEGRIRGRRTESDAMIEERLEKAKSELQSGHYYDYQVVNDSVTAAAAKIAELIRYRLSECR